MPVRKSEPKTPSGNNLLVVLRAEEDHGAIQPILARSNWNVHHCSRWADALLYLHSHDVSIIVIDSDMVQGEPEMRDAFQCLAVVPKLIATYRFSEENSALRLLDRGVYHIMPKPFNATEVLQALAFASPHAESAQRPVASTVD